MKYLIEHNQQKYGGKPYCWVYKKVIPTEHNDDNRDFELKNIIRDAIFNESDLIFHSADFIAFVLPMSDSQPFSYIKLPVEFVKIVE